ncbi:MAG: hypothetical protein M0C28_16940 [Candidatus Moduliflexus flocculans]|nr:hypothetical protein [Candidatus Moduliflexus flocculans]
MPDDLFNQRQLSKIINYADPGQDTYYKAILQNLFFATLNTEMNKDSQEQIRQREQGRYWASRSCFEGEDFL